MIQRLPATIASAFAAVVLLVPAAAQARPGYGYGYSYGYGYGYQRGAGFDGGYRGDYASARGRRGYDAPPPPPPPPAYYGRGYRDADYGPPGYRGGRRYRCDRGTGGTIIGAIAGGLLGNGIAGRGDRTTGTVLGAGVGALAGRAIDRNC